MPDADKIEEIATLLIPEEIEDDLMVHTWDTTLRVRASAKVTDVDHREWVDYTEALREAGFRNMESEATRGGVMILADPPEELPKIEGQ